MKLEREHNIYLIEQYYCERLEELAENEQFDDAHALFEEFVVDSEEPGDWMFIADVTNVC
jgi:hypothetical protein